MSPRKITVFENSRFLRFAIAMLIADPRHRARFPRQEKVMLHCDLRVRWKVASDWRFRAAISEPKTPSFCGISGDLAPSTRKSLAIAIVRFCCAKEEIDQNLPFPQDCSFQLRLNGTTRPQLGPLFVLKVVRSQVLGRDSSTVSKVLSDRKVLFKHEQWPSIAVNGRLQPLMAVNGGHAWYKIRPQLGPRK